MSKRQKLVIDKLLKIVGDLVKEQRKIWQLQQFEFMEKKDITFKKNNAIAYVDGSCDSKAKISTYGIIVVLPDKIKKYHGQVVGIPDNICDSRSAEFGATIQAVGIALSLGVKKLVIKYDCKAIADCLKGKVKKSDKVGLWFRGLYEKRREKMKIKLKKVKAHSNDKYNEEADRLARTTLRQLVNKKKKEVSKKAKLKPKVAVCKDVVILEKDVCVEVLNCQKVGEQALVLRRETLPMVI